MEILLGALAEAMISLVLADIAQRPGLAALREKLRGDSPEKLALQHALAKSYQVFAEQYPQIAHALFDAYFLGKPAVAAELAKLLTPDRTPSVPALSLLWQEQFSSPPALEVAAELDFFLHSLASEIKRQPALKPFTDSRAFDQLYLIAERADWQVNEQRTTNEHLGDIRSLLAEVAAKLSEKSAQLHIESAGGAVVQGNASAEQDVVMRDKITYIYSSPTPPPPAPEEHAAATAQTNFPNPFSDRGRINDPSRFFGRQQIVRELQQALTVGNSIALIGPPESGKSSLLYSLFQTRQDWMPSHQVIYLDLQGVIDEHHFCEKTLRELSTTNQTKSLTAKDALRQLDRALSAHKVLLMLDEVERLTHRDFTPRLQGMLRSWVQNGNFLLLAASEQPLHQVFPPSDPTSPLHNVFRSTDLKYFTRDEVQNFVRQRLAACPIQFDEAEMSALWQQTHGHPGQLQRAAELLFKRKMAGS